MIEIDWFYESNAVDFSQTYFFSLFHLLSFFNVFIEGLMTDCELLFWVFCLFWFFMLLAALYAMLACFDVILIFFNNDRF
jgi:hypothetical protein